MSALNLAVIPGDGIGPEVTSVALDALQMALSGIKVDVKTYDLGSE